MSRRNAQERVILPNRPLFLVHKGWTTKSKRGTPSTISVVSEAPPRNTTLQPRLVVSALSSQVEELQSTPNTGGTIPQVSKLIDFVGDGIQTRGERACGRPSAFSQETLKWHKPSKKNLSQLRARIVEEPQIRNDPDPAGTSTLAADFSMSALTPLSKRSLSPYEFTIPSSVAGQAAYYVSYYFDEISAYLYPLSSLFLFNPAKQNWLPIALTDGAWFHTILHVSARVLATNTGCHVNVQDAACLLEHVLHWLNRRISTKGMPSDETMGAVACLAMLNNSECDYRTSWLHARGLAEMIRMRGGILCVHESLRMKVYRGILDIAVDSDKGSLLPHLHQSQPPLEHVTTYSAVANSTVVGLYLPSHPVLASIFQHISNLSQVIERTLADRTSIDPNAFDQELFSLQQGLLSCNSADEHNDAFRISALIYTKSLARPTVWLKKTSRSLVHKLCGLLVGRPMPSTPIMLWSLFMGALAAFEGTGEQEWLMGKIAVCALELLRGKTCWDSVRGKLRGVLWISTIHDDLGQALWSRV